MRTFLRLLARPIANPWPFLHDGQTGNHLRGPGNCMASVCQIQLVAMDLPRLTVARQTTEWIANG